ncbi:nitroreductase [Trueperella pyogenes]
MDFSEVLRSRVSVRAYLDKPVEPDVLAAVLDDARHCPSWSNARGYLLALAQGERLTRLKEAYVEAWTRSLSGEFPPTDFNTRMRYPGELRDRQVANGKRYYAHLGVARGDREAQNAWQRRNLEFFDAPVVGFIFVHRQMLPFSAQDAGILLQTLMLSATAHGLGTVGLGTLTTWRHPVDTEFEIPEDYALITGFALGYPDPDAHINAFCAEHPQISMARPLVAESGTE